MCFFTALSHLRFNNSEHLNVLFIVYFYIIYIITTEHRQSHFVLPFLNRKVSTQLMGILNYAIRICD